MKRIYLAHAITNGETLDTVSPFVKWLKKNKCGVTHPSPTLFAEELARTALECIRQADLIIADVSTYSHGVGFELGYAYALGKETIVIAHVASRSRLSKFIQGLFPEVICYEDATELIDRVALRLKIGGRTRRCIPHESAPSLRKHLRISSASEAGKALSLAPDANGPALIQFD